MKRASKVLLTVGAIYSLVVAITFVFCMIMFIIFSLPFFMDLVRQGLESGEISTNIESVDAALMFTQAVFITCAVTFGILSIFCFINSSFAFKARKEQTRSLLILNIVFGFLSGVEINAVGGILGLIALNIWGDKEKDIIENKE